MKQKIRDTEAVTEPLMNSLEMVENEISELLSKENFEKVKENFDLLSRSVGSCNMNGMWKLSARLFPKHPKSMPVSKKNLAGRLISNP